MSRKIRGLRLTAEMPQVTCLPTRKRARDGAFLIEEIRRTRVALQYADRKNEDQEFAQVAQGSSSREPPCSPQGPHLHHQQAESALQGSSGLNRRRGRMPLNRAVMIDRILFEVWPWRFTITAMRFFMP